MDGTETRKYARITSYSLTIIATFFILLALKAGASFIVPVVIAFFIFILANPFLVRMDKIKVPKAISLIITMLVVAVVFILFIYAASQMVNSLLARLPRYVQRVNALDSQLSMSLKRFFDIPENQEFSLLQTLNIDWFGILTNFLTTVSARFANIFSDCMLVYLYLFFILLERSTIYPKIIVSLPEEKSKRVLGVVTSMSTMTSRYLSIKVIVSFVTGVLFYLVAYFSRLDFALVWGFGAFVLNFIPTIGSIIVTGAAVVVAIIQFIPHWGRIVVIALSLVAIQMVLGNIIEPRFQGNRLNLSPLMILISLALWSYIWGLVGMFLAVPLTALLQNICSQSPALKPIAIFISTGSTVKMKKKSLLKRWKERMKKRKKDKDMPPTTEELKGEQDSNGEKNT